MAKRQSRLGWLRATTALAVAVALLVISFYAVDHETFMGFLVREFGLALLVAVFIWVIFEVFVHEQNDEVWAQRAELIAKNVFFGVFKRNFPSDFIREANILVLDHTFIRSGLNVTYTISDECFTGRAGDTQDFVKLRALARFKVRNVGNASAPLPIAIGLPNPLLDEMKAHCKVNRVTIKSANFTENPDLTEAEEEFRERLQDDDQYQVPFILPSRNVAPGEEIEIIFDYHMAKESEDTEIFQTKYPTDSVIITIMDKGPTPRVVRARAIHYSTLENDTAAESSGTYNFKLERYLLPHQGFAIWWKRLPPPTEGTVA